MVNGGDEIELNEALYIGNSTIANSSKKNARAF